MEKNPFTIQFLSDPGHLYLGNHPQLSLEASKLLELKDFALYHIEELTFEDQAPRREAFENFISSLRVEGVSFLYLIMGDSTGVRFYCGVVRDLNDVPELLLNVNDIGEQILAPSLRGNFRGSKINELSPASKQSLRSKLDVMSCFGYLEGVPGINEDNEDVQGVDRLIDVMLGDEFGVAIVSKPLSQEDIFQMEKKLAHTYSGVVPFAKQSIQEGGSKGVTQGQTTTINRSDTVGDSTSTGQTEGTTVTSGRTEGTSKSVSKGTSKSNSEGSSTTGESTTGQEGSNSSKTWNDTNSSSTSTTSSANKSVSTGESVADASSQSDNHSSSITIEWVNKEAQDWISYLDEVIFPRLDYGKARGIYVTTALLFTTNTGNLLKLGNTIQSLYSGQSGNKVPLKLHKLEPGPCLDSLVNWQIPRGVIRGASSSEQIARSAVSQHLQDERVQLGNWMSTRELSLMAGLPQKEIVGLSLKEEVEFGLNTPASILQDERIQLGSLVQSGRVLSSIKVELSKEHLNKHVFVTGVTGSGKTTTCQKLLLDSNLPFLVIEPAKTEYRILTESCEDLIIYTLGKNTAAPFRLNPFEFLEHESITSRVDMIKASLEASFDMEAAIPQLLEAALYECYEDYGWNIATNKNKLYKMPFADGVYAFPTLEDLLAKVERVVAKQGFDERLKNDYIGSIKARLQSLMVGSKGLMLNTKRSVNFVELLDQKVILELEEIRSGSEKSLIMGFILMNLVEALKAKYMNGAACQHITLLEEAHRLLSKYVPGDSLNKKQGVEVFTDMLAEVRKYGESLIIVDQIPSKLTSEVLKNTNTKIVHKLFAEDDKEAVGNTMALTEEQKDFLSYLEAGRAVVITQGWSKPLQVQIQAATNTTSHTVISDQMLRQNILRMYGRSYKRGIWQGLEAFDTEPSLDQIEKYLEFVQDNPLASAYREFVTKTDTRFPFKACLEELLRDYSLDFIACYLTRKYYKEAPDFSLDKRQLEVQALLEDLLRGVITTKLLQYADTLTIQ